MIRLVLLTVALGLSACAGETYEPLPTSGYQWQQRQDRIERQAAQARARCDAMDKQSERYARECARAGVSNP